MSPFWNTEPDHYAFEISSELAPVISKWWVWWNMYRLSLQLVAQLLRTLDKQGRWYLLIDVTPGNNAKKSRNITLCRATVSSPVWSYVKNRPILWNVRSDTTFGFRYKFDRNKSNSLTVKEHEIVIAEPDDGPAVRLIALKDNTSIQDSETLVLKSEGWPTKEAAEEAGERFVAALRRALAKICVGANFGEFGGRGMLTRAGVRYLEEEFGTRLINDARGLIVYETLPEPRFGTIQADAVISKSQENFMAAFELALDGPEVFEDRETLAFEFFNASFFQVAPVPRFVLLVMAVEAMLDLGKRRTEVQAHVRDLLNLTLRNADLTAEEIDSLTGPLGRLQEESIKQAGRRMCKAKLGDREYAGRPTMDFFAHCYDIRSQIVHGNPSPQIRDEVAGTVGTLELFVSEFLSAPISNGPN